MTTPQVDTVLARAATSGDDDHDLDETVDEKLRVIERDTDDDDLE